MNEEKLQRNSGMLSAVSYLLSTLSCGMQSTIIINLVHRPFIFLTKEISVPTFISSHHFLCLLFFRTFLSFLIFSFLPLISKGKYFQSQGAKSDLQ